MFTVRLYLPVYTVCPFVGWLHIPLHSVCMFAGML